MIKISTHTPAENREPEFFEMEATKMNKKLNKNTRKVLITPNDDSLGHCYAPVENGNANTKKKQHFSVGKSPEANWVLVPCDPGCNFKR